MCYLPACSNNYHCPPGSKCLNGECKYTTDICLGNSDCPNGQSCHVKGCNPSQDPCKRMNCRGYPCYAGKCWRDPCTKHSDCAMFKKCLNGKCQNEEIDTKCQNFNDCPKGMMCYFGICIVNKCINSLACPPGSSCDQGICIETIHKQCNIDHDCFGGDICENHICVTRNITCQSQQECLSHMKCSGKICTNPPPNCNTHEDCQIGQMCIFRRCITLTDDNDDFCQADLQCPKGYLCKHNQCQRTKPECVHDQDCPDPDDECMYCSKCMEGKCGKPPGGNCQQDFDCHFQDIKGQCIFRSCVLPCKEDEECPTLYYCSQDSTGRGNCTNGPGNECERDKDCGREGKCENKKCVIRCKKPHWCPRNYDCINLECRINPNTTCTKDWDCGIGGKCENSNCIVTCENNQDCGNSHYCAISEEKGVCKPKPPDTICDDDQDCKPNEECLYCSKCMEGKCGKPPGGNCEQDFDCHFQDIKGQCIFGNCVLPCKEDEECPKPYYCSRDSTGGNCTNPPGKECKEDKECGINGKCENNECIIVCQKSQDCPRNYDCDNFKCIIPIDPSPPCKIDVDCGIRGICEDSKCIFTCKDSQDCPSSSFCEKSGKKKQGVCKPEPPEVCDSHQDCDPLKKCLGGICGTPPGGNCEKDIDCHWGKIKGKCMFGECVIPCQEDEGCPKPFWCSLDSEKCVPPPKWPCDDDKDCGKGNICKNGMCSHPCEEKIECPKNYECLDSQCIPGPCKDNEDCGYGGICKKERCQERCVDNSHCPDEYFCAASTSLDKYSQEEFEKKYCMPENCENNDECGNDATCDNFKCVFSCKTNKDCPDKQGCKDHKCETPIVGDNCKEDEDCGLDGLCDSFKCITPCDCPGCAECPFICKNNLCKTPDPGDDCKEDEDCGLDGRCENFKCVTPCDCPGCAECPSSFACEYKGSDNKSPTCPTEDQGYCRIPKPKPGDDCSRHADCGVGGRCQGSKCRIACKHHCECPDPYKCRKQLKGKEGSQSQKTIESTHSYCRKPMPGDPCRDDEFCGEPPAYCEDFKCVIPCDGPSDCPNPYKCTYGKKRPKQGFCTNPKPGDDCKNNEDCGNNGKMECEEFKCVIACKIDSDCPANQV